MATKQHNTIYRLNKKANLENERGAFQTYFLSSSKVRR